MEKLKTAPPSGRLAARMQPPWASMMLRQMVSPSPAPRALPVKTW
jgi:hypothetical protein